MRFHWLALTVALLHTAFLNAQPLVVETEPLPPEEQRLKFHLPEGFEIQLVASEPDIGQPMNMNFDARGRLWVTSSVEYPYPVAGAGVEPREERWGKPEEREPRDWVTVLTGIDDTGKPEKVTRFAEGLNIPIGIIPDGDGAIIYSIPNIERFRDTDGDGKADERTKLYGPFGNLDTHGMVNSFTRGLDGWIYACHGFRNTSKVQGTDGHIVEMNSGNTFRFKPDGSRIEHWTHGQVNPFGLCFDPWGNLYSADCHSMPLTCLLRGAYYQSFGKPHDGLGFAPDMIDHNHGSTGICGCVWYEAEQFPAEHNGCIFLCNPVTGRVHRDKIEFHGSSPWAVTQPDFITCDDGWFRPVDVKLGPDGALYIADFYNAIIGHYEVPLQHPRRDRTHGRIWRVVYRGERGVEGAELRGESPEPNSLESPAVTTAGPAPAQFDLTESSLGDLAQRLGETNLTIRYAATQQIIDRFSRDEVHQILSQEVEQLPMTSVDEQRVAHALRVLGQTDSIAKVIYPGVRGALVQTHWLRALAEAKEWSPDVTETADRLTHQYHDGHVRRAAVEAISAQPYGGSLASGMQFSSYPTVLGNRHDDTHYFHATLIGIRNQLGLSENVDYVLKKRINWAIGLKQGVEFHWSQLAHAMPNSTGARILLAAWNDPSGNPLFGSNARHIARYGDQSQLKELFDRLQHSQVDRELDAEVALVRGVQQGLAERGEYGRDRLSPWAAKLALKLLDAPHPPQLSWTPVAYGPKAKPESAFGVQTRPFADGQQGALLHSSFPPGETRTGILRSDAFDLPAKLSFFIAGHNGLPSQPVTPNNLIRLHDDEQQTVLFEALPPRNDTAQLVEWDLSPYQGRRGYIEIVDGDDRTAYAWLAVGRFSVEGLNPTIDSPQVDGCRLIAELKLTDLAPRLVELVRSTETTGSLRSAAARSLLTLHPDARLAVLREAAASTLVPDQLREQCYATIATHHTSVPDASSARDAEDVATLLKSIVQAAPADAQRQLATLLAADRRGAQSLLTLVEQGAASPRLLQDAALVERLTTWNLDQFDARLARLTADLPAQDAAITQQLEQRREQFRDASQTLGASGTLDIERGRALFKQHCAACHQLSGEGAKIGPQLDGVGIRGPDRLLEDILDPNRNVDAAFRTTVLVLNDGRIQSGLVRREEGATLVLADNQGKEFTVATTDIDHRKDSALSLMPVQLVEKLPGDDLNHLIAYLLTTRAPARPDAE